MSSSLFGNTSPTIPHPNNNISSSNRPIIVTNRSGISSGHHSRRSSSILSIQPLVNLTSHLFSSAGSSKDNHHHHHHNQQGHHAHDTLSDQDLESQQQQQEQQRRQAEADLEHARRQQSMLFAAAEKRRRARQTPNIQLPRYTRDIWLKDPDLIEVRGGEESILFTVEFREQWQQGMLAFIGGEWQVAKRMFMECNRIYVLHHHQDELLPEHQKNEDDGPAVFLLTYMKQHEFIAPSNWMGFRDENKEEGGH